MSTSDQLDPATIALLDQVLAGSVEYLDGLCRAYRDTLGEAQSLGQADAMTILACARTLRMELPVEVLAGTLAVAIMQLVKEPGDG